MRNSASVSWRVTLLKSLHDSKNDDSLLKYDEKWTSNLVGIRKEVHYWRQATSVKFDGMNYPQRHDISLLR